MFTAPVEDAVEGEVFFDVPMTLEGQRVENVHLTFEGGEVVDFSAGAGEDALAGCCQLTTVRADSANWVSE